MENVDYFLSIAEISGVFLGFAALVSLVDQSTGERRENLQFYLTNMVFISLLVIVASMFPILLTEYDVPRKFVWALSAGFVFLLNIGIIFYMSRLTQGWRKAHKRVPVLSFVAWSVEPFFQVPLILCVVGIWQEYSMAFYLTSLVAALVQIALLLANLVVSAMLKKEDR